MIYLYIVRIQYTVYKVLLRVDCVYCCICVDYELWLLQLLLILYMQSLTAHLLGVCTSTAVYRYDMEMTTYLCSYKYNLLVRKNQYEHTCMILATASMKCFRVEGVTYFDPAHRYSVK